jgi:hypothetical protein
LKTEFFDLLNQNIKTEVKLKTEVEKFETIELFCDNISDIYFYGDDKFFFYRCSLNKSEDGYIIYSRPFEVKERMNKNIEGVGEVVVPSTPKEKIQNFIYHYKWHTVVALLLVVAILVCSFQFCAKEEYDAYILYAGSKNIGRTAEDGDVAEIATVISSLKRITGDFDENGDWKDYEAFDSKEEGSYNDQGQWVDKDGKVYDGYFDEKGRWIDYTYVNADGEVVDNGYFDKKIKKWVPYGYFDDNGEWKEYN